MRCLSALLGVAFAATTAIAQVDQNVWVASSSGVYQVSPAGVLLGTYAAPCFGPIGPCQFTTARDQFGNVYVASVTYFAPGIGGTIRMFRTGMGVTTLLSGGFSAIVVDAAGDPSRTDRTWVLLTEAPDGGWGLAGHANTNEELIAAARAQIAELQARKPDG